MKLERAIRLFENAYDAAVSEVVEIPLDDLHPEERDKKLKQRERLHPSSLPICALRLSYEKLLAVDTEQIVYRNFSQDYYLNVGTLTHELLQYWFGRTGKQLGNWSCMSCKKPYKHSVKPKKCKCGNTDFYYHEIGGHDKILDWHTDGIFKIQDSYWCIDWKTTSDYQLEKHRKTGTVFPYYANKLQIEAYVPLIEEELGIKLDGYLFGYVSRSTPNSKYGRIVVGQQIDDAYRDKMIERLDFFKKSYMLSKKVLDDPRGTLKKAIGMKLCPSQKVYKEKIEGYNPCPLCDVCFNRTALIRQLKEVL